MKIITSSEYKSQYGYAYYDMVNRKFTIIKHAPLHFGVNHKCLPSNVMDGIMYSEYIPTVSDDGLKFFKLSRDETLIHAIRLAFD